MAAEAGGPTARVGGIVAAVLACAAFGIAAAPQTVRDPAPEPLLAQPDGAPQADPGSLRALALRVQRPANPNATPIADAPVTAAPPLPGPAWNDPDSVNWADVPEGDRGPVRDRLLERRGGPRPGGRLLERLRGELRSAAVGGRPVGDIITPAERLRRLSLK